MDDVQKEISMAATMVPKTASMKDAGGLGMSEIKGITSEGHLTPAYGAPSMSTFGRAVKYLNEDVRS